MRTTLRILLLVSALAFGLSETLEPYKDRAAVAEAMTLFPYQISESRVASEKYWAIRDAELTLKFTLQDYGATAMILLAALLVFRVGYGAKTWRDLAALATPTHWWKLIVLGAVAAAVTTAAYVVALLVDASRDAFPPWADSLGIPLAGTPLIFVLLFSVAAVYGFAAAASYVAAQPLRKAFRISRRPHVVWLIFFGGPLLVSAMAVVTTTLVGDFVFVAPALLWFAFFLLAFGSKPQIANHSWSGRAEARRST